MTRTEAFNKIRQILFGEQKFEQAKLADGTIVSWEGELTEGTALFVISEDGNQTPAPDGEHTLEDGTVVVTEGGLVISIVPAEQEIEIEVEDKKDEMASEFEKMFAELVDRVAKFEAEFSEMKSKFEANEQAMAAVKETVESVKGDTESKFNKVVEIVEAISKEPAVDVDHNAATQSFKRKQKLDKKEQVINIVNKVLTNK